MQDRRKQPRLDEERRVSVMLIPEHPLPGEGLLTLSCEATDANRKGIRFRSFRHIAEHSFVRVDIPLHEESRKSVSLSGIVRWCRRLEGEERYSVGVEFLDLDDEDLRAWTHFMQRQFRG